MVVSQLMGYPPIHKIAEISLCALVKLLAIRLNEQTTFVKSLVM